MTAGVSFEEFRKWMPKFLLETEMEKRSPVSGVIITPEQEANIQKIMEKAQLEMATNVLKTLVDTLDSELFDNNLFLILNHISQEQ